MITGGTVLFLLDLVLASILWPAALWIGRPDFGGMFDAPIDARIFLYPAADILLLFAMGLYRRDALVDTAKSIGRVPLVVGMGAALSIGLSMALGAGAPTLFVQPGGSDQAILFALATVTFAIGAILSRSIVHALLRRRILRRRLLIVGAGQRAWDLLRMITKEGGSLHYDIAFLHHPSLGEIDPRLVADSAGRIVQCPRFDVLTAARAEFADEIVVAPDDRRGVDLERLLECKRAGFPVVQYLSFIETEIRRVDLKRMELGWLLYSDGFTFGALDRFLKRAFDLIVSSLVLLLAAPLLVGGIIAIRWDGRGPIFYRQERVTLDNRVFWILKLRTMRVDAETQGAVWAAARDSRITRVGAFLRRTRIDELPQLLNILKGDMSFVGPRPERPVFISELAAQIPLFNERHMVKAGLTGWAQINYPYGASVDDARSKLSYDLYYVKNFSILFDFVILLQTLRVVLWPSGVR